MIKRKTLLLLGLGLWLAVPDSHGQVMSSPSADTLFVLPLAGDTLPTIKMKFEPAVVVLYLFVPTSALFLGGHSYKIQGINRFSAARAKPYFDATGNELIMDFYRKQQQNRIAWYATTGTGYTVFLIGFAHAIASISNPAYANAVSTYLILGSGLILIGIGTRVACFRNMRKAVNLYNYQYAGRVPMVSLRLGLPSSTPAGLGLYVKF